MRGGVEAGHGVGGGGRRCRCGGPLHGVPHHGCFTRFAQVAHLTNAAADTATHATAHAATDPTTDVVIDVTTHDATDTAAALATTATTATPCVRRRVVLRRVPLRHCQLLVLDRQTLYL